LEQLAEDISALMFRDSYCRERKFFNFGGEIAAVCEKGRSPMEIALILQEVPIL